MFHKFKITTYATLLLIGVFVLPYAGNVADVNAENYNCSGSQKEVRQCLKAVISERDEAIGDLQTQFNAVRLKNSSMKTVMMDNIGHLENFQKTDMRYLSNAILSVANGQDLPILDMTEETREHSKQISNMKGILRNVQDLLEKFQSADLFQAHTALIKTEMGIELCAQGQNQYC